jgi:sialate O-acetylesterase
LTLVAHHFACNVYFLPGDPVGDPYGNIHPRDKEAVGYRLSLVIRAMVFQDTVQFLGPTYNGFTVTGQPPNVVINVQFGAASIGGGLVLQSASCPAAIGQADCACFEIQLSDGNWYNATSSSLNGNTVDVAVNSPNGLTGTGIRYLFADWPVAVLFNKDGLPAGPFYVVNSDHNQLTIN